MRMSDWSSDVCSSDLGRCDVGTLWRREFADRDFAETRRIGLELGIVSGDAFLRIFARGRQARGRNGRDVVTGIMQRSEEHTSELQSLMRISYAVFCLKKKKNNTSNT